MPMAAIAIVGAGAAGLAAGGALARAGHEVTIYEKSRGVGGRVTTRRAEGCLIDHGANYLKAPNAAIQALVATIPGAVDITLPVWALDGDGRIGQGDPAQNAEAKWTWPGGLTTLAKHLAQGLDVRRETTVVRIVDERRRAKDERPGVSDEVGLTQGPNTTASPFVLRPSSLLIDSADATYGPFDAVLLTPPAAQAAAIVEASEIEAGAREALLAALAPARYRRCISVAIAYPRRPEVPWYALVNSDRRHDISWLACEHVKPGRAPEGIGLLMAQMAPGWSERHWEALPKGTYAPGAWPAPVAAVDQLIGELLGASLGSPLWADAHRWRYALPDGSARPLPEGAAGIFLAGDMLAGQGRVHLAIESGWTVAEQIAAMVR
jgi:renalase